VPYLHDLNLDEEYSVAMKERPTPPRAWKPNEEQSPRRKLRVGVIAFPHLSNFTDFDALAAEPSVALAFLRHPEQVALADVLILPGSKQTLDDFDWLLSQGFVSQILQHHAKRKLIVGICGGFQMLGLSMHDSEGMENNGMPAEREGLKIIRAQTIFQREKTTQMVAGRLCSEILMGQLWAETKFKGYEIHLGETRREADVPAFAAIARAASGAPESTERYDGAISEDGRAFGTYVHGIFDDDKFRHSFIAVARACVGLVAAKRHAWATSEREARFEQLANHLRVSLDMERIRGWIGAERTRGC
ncbi:MAG: cobyric acid synthase, partial [Candidatus Angelobacter sp.]